MKVSDVSQEQHKARSFFTFLKGKKNDAIVDHVFSGSRLKLFVAKGKLKIQLKSFMRWVRSQYINLLFFLETCLLTFLIGGIQCPRGSRPVGNGVFEPAEPFGEEALAYTKSLLTQRDVTIEVETMDKAS
jgi:staphylococcal nuclease domain-containing protein 1